jgi:hypothetical protein
VVAPAFGSPALQALLASGQDPVQAAIGQVLTNVSPLKGPTVELFPGAQPFKGTATTASQAAADCTNYNAVSVLVVVTGSGSAVVTVLGVGGGSGGVSVALADPNAVKSVLTTTQFDVMCGQPFAIAQISGLTGFANAGDGIRVFMTPFRAGGSGYASYRAAADLLGATAIVPATANPLTGSALTGFGGLHVLVVLLTVSAKTLAAAHTIDVYVQTSPDDGTTWDDVLHFAQITNGAVPNGTYVAKLVNPPAVGYNDRATADAALAANSRVDYVADQLRYKIVPTALAGGDSVTLRLRVVAMS